MRIDDFLPTYDVSKRYQIDVHAPIEKVYQAARSLNSRDSRVVSWLFRLRGFPEDALSIDGLVKFGFVILGETPPEEMLFGLAGRFWTPSADIQRLTPRAFKKFEKKGFAKAVANISFSKRGAGVTRASTETRVYCYDTASRLYFRIYWSLIGPFSGTIRKKWLRIIKKQAESSLNSI